MKSDKEKYLKKITELEKKYEKLLIINKLYESHSDWLSTNILSSHPVLIDITKFISIPLPKIVNSLLTPEQAILKQWRKIGIDFAKQIKIYRDKPIIDYGPIFIKLKDELDKELKNNIETCTKHLEDLENFICNESWTDENINIKNSFLQWIISLKSVYMAL